MSLSKPIFTAQMNRITQTFGKEYFPPPRLEEIWKVVKDLPDAEFTKIVSRLVGEHSIKYPPTVLEFRTFAETKLKELRDVSGMAEWQKVMDEALKRKKELEAMTPEQREEKRQRILGLVNTKLKTTGG